MVLISIIEYYVLLSPFIGEERICLDCETTRPRPKPAAPPARAPELAEEIQRIQVLLRRLDGTLEEKDEVTLKDLAQAVTTAGVGGRSIAQLRKFEKELEIAVKDEDYEQARASLFEAIEKLRQRRKTKVHGWDARKRTVRPDREQPAERDQLIAEKSYWEQRRNEKSRPDAHNIECKKRVGGHDHRTGHRWAGKAWP